MKLFKTKLRVLALAAGSLAISMVGANAANSFYTPGDLVLYFQQEGDTDTVYVSLGNTATVFRNATSDILNTINISTQLNAAFGASWADATNLYMGVAGVWGVSSTNSTLQNGDPHRTLYVGQSRSGVGTVGTANSSGYTLGTDTGIGTGATNIRDMNTPFDDALGTNSYDAAVVVSPTSVSAIDNANQNPFLAPGLQGNGFGVFSGGVQQVGTASTFAASFGAESNVEFALDLYRIQARNDVTGQYGEGAAIRTGTYEGSLTLDSTGNVSFIAAVPEPSTYALFGSAALVIGFIAVRHRKTSKKQS
ncbi:MAG: PEP-CTERM sorting domain-containing protein [Terrimicrobiaceae bacterium]